MFRTNKIYRLDKLVEERGGLVADAKLFLCISISIFIFIFLQKRKYTHNLTQIQIRIYILYEH